MKHRDDFIKACQQHFDIEPIYQRLKSFTINEWLVLMNYLDSDLDYFVTATGRLGFQDLRGYYENEFTFIDEFPVIDMGIKKLADLEVDVYDKIVSTFMDVIDNYNGANPKEKINYTF